MVDKRRSMDIESILGMESIDQTDGHELDDARETTRLIDVKSISEDCVDHAVARNNNGYSAITQLSTFNNNNGHVIKHGDVCDGADDESPLSPSELDGLLNHPSLELNGHSLLHTSTPVSNNNKPALQPKPDLEKLKNSKNAILARNALNGSIVSNGRVETTVSSPDTLHENDDITMRSISPCKPKDPAEMSLKERLALFERNSSDANVIIVPKTPTNGSKRWTEKWLEQTNNGGHTTFAPPSIPKKFEMVPLHGHNKSYGEHNTSVDIDISRNINV